jgi:hypothetical protein
MIPVPELQEIDLIVGEVSFLPKMGEIPDEFRDPKNKWVKLFAVITCSGFYMVDLYPKAGVVKELAERAIRAAMASYEPSPERKEAGVAFLMSEWFEDWEMRL